VQIFFAKVVSTHPTMVSTQHLSLKDKNLKKCLDCVDTSQRAGHMKGECPENKKEKHKKFQKFKKPKAMVATWSDEDSSEEEENKKSSSSESEEICFMANNSEEKAVSTPSYLVSTHTLGQVDRTVFQCRHCPLARLFKSWVPDKPLLFLRGIAPLQTLF
ncbi:hypothetical protein Taro_025390, partial [Colocasia esculenta]|nr:hypothetical protein [Colocasia esculenta]